MPTKPHLTKKNPGIVILESDPATREETSPLMEELCPPVYSVDLILWAAEPRLHNCCCIAAPTS